MGVILESTIIEVVGVFFLLLWAFYKNATKKYSYWEDRGVPYISPVFPFGSLKESFLGKLHIGEMYDKYYRHFKGERYFGVYDIKHPILIVRDPDLIKHVLTKDFHHFTNRFVFPINPKTDYISLHLFNLSGPEWKKMRLKLAPTFTSGKMKMMFLLMAKSGEQLRNSVENEISNNPIVEVKDFLARFTMDIIASCAFGLEINLLANKDSEFYYYGMKIFKPSVGRVIKRLVFTTFPFLNKIFSAQFVGKDISDFFTRIIGETVEYREKHKIVRNDFLDLLIKIRNNKNLLEEQTNGNSEQGKINHDNKEGLTIKEMTAQSFIFFIAGFETASSTMTFCLFELARNPDIQERLYQEIREVLSRHGGKPTYQALQEMTYMDKVINETLRLYASLATIDRTCSEKYKIPDSDVVLDEGIRVTIPSFAIHHDPEYYPDPYKFDPERFTPEKVKERNPYLHLPFGEGPRMCIGMRFGLLQTKIGLTEMVSNFEFGLTPDVQIPIVISKRSFVTMPDKPLKLRVTKRMVDPF